MVLTVKNLFANAVDIRELGSIPGSGRSPGEEKTTESSILAWEIHGHRNLAGYSTLGHKQSEMTEET